MTRSPWILVASVWAGFVAFGQLMKLCVAPMAAEHPWIGQAALKLGLILIVLALARWQGMSWESLGVRRSVRKAGIRAWGAGLALGTVISIAALATGSTGLAAIVGRFSFPQLVVWVWIVSSVSEELLCRGWFQAQLGRRAAGEDASTRFREVVLPSAVLFGSLHLTLFWAGTGLATAALMVTATTLLGLICAAARERTGSLFPAIGAHVLFNVGGFVGGIIYTIGYRVATGHLPLPPS